MPEEPSAASTLQKLSRRGGRKLLGFYVAALALLGLAMAGAFLYSPLKLRYAIYRVRYARSRDVPSGAYHEWAQACMQGALRGNREAIDALLMPPPRIWSSSDIGRVLPESCYYVLALNEPELFFEVLEGHDKKRGLEVVAEIFRSGRFEKATGRRMSILFYNSDPESLEVLCEAVSGCQDADLRHLAQAARDFLRRRFAKELAEAEEQKAHEK